MANIRGLNMRLRTDEKGMVSIMVTMLFVMIAALVVVGFTQIASRNSRQALDRHLSAQAQYAAETAINDAQSKLIADNNAGATLQEQNNCSGAYTKNSGVIGAATDGVSYTCLLVKPDVTDLSYDNVTDNSLVFPLNASTGALGSLDITWRKSSSVTGNPNLANCPTSDQLPLVTDWQPSDCGYGMLRLELVPNEAASFSATSPAGTVCNGNFVCDTNARTMSLFAAPAPNSASVAPGAASVSYNGGSNRHANSSNVTQGIRVVPRCTNTEGCKISITGLGFQYAFARIRMSYVDASNVQVGYSNAATDSRTFVGAQVMVDATGKAQDVLRRVQVRLPLASSSTSVGQSSLSDYAIQTSGSICKKFSVAPGSPGIASEQSGCTN